MKLVIIAGSGAVGKMTVGQELMKQTGLRLFHNHMMIEPVLEIFGRFEGRVIGELREVIFREFAQSDLPGMIFTYMWAFDQQADWDYIAHVADIFRERGADIYWVELVADQAVRLERNRTENRLAHKASKRNLAFSEGNILHEDEHYRLVSNEGEIPFENYVKIDNTNLSPEEVVKIIRERFGL
ncbi:MAG: AAA family ATPase [Clostridia bacterium]|nr:AAA family ATPase [Clostridia bacterium]